MDQKKSKFKYPKLDQTISDPQQRNKIVHEIVNTLPKEKLTPYYLDQLTKYLVLDKNNKKNKNILTDNRMVTVNKRETSFQGFVEKLENGEDGIYNLMTGGDRNILLVPKIEITEEDIATIPGLKQLREEIKKIEEKQKKAYGKKKYLLTKQLIQMRRDQYILKTSYKPPIFSQKAIRKIGKIQLNEKITINEKGEPESDCLISLFNPTHVSFLLTHYSKIKEQVWGDFQNDLYYLIQDLENMIDKIFKKDYPQLYKIIIYKIDGLTNKEVVKKVEEEYNFKYSSEYLSQVWRKKIPKMIVQYAKQEWLLWHFTFEEKGQWKRCSRCHQVKLAHPYFFTKNKTAKDGWYSLCKTCRNKGKKRSK